MNSDKIKQNPKSVFSIIDDRKDSGYTWEEIETTNKIRRIYSLKEREIKPLVSVIVPIYNVEKYLSKSLNSLKGQTLKNIEIICVEDCSTDGSMKVLERIARTDKRIKIVKHKINSGLSEARNTGISIASAPYIMFLDSDDTFELDPMQNYIKKSIKRMKK
jgi:GT2 family glycosyltransferase